MKQNRLKQLIIVVLLLVMALPAYATDYSNMTSSQIANQRAYLNKLIAAGGGNAEWAKKELASLNSQVGSSSGGGSSGSSSSSGSTSGSTGSSSTGGTSTGGNSSTGGSSGGTSSGGSSYNRPSSSTSTLTQAETTAKTQQMAENSAAWYVAQAEYKAALAKGDTVAAVAAKRTMDSLHSTNTSIANQIAGSGGSVSFDETTGVTTIRTSSGTTITNANGVSTNGSSTNMVYQTRYSDGTVDSTDSVSQYSDSGIQAYLDAGGTIDGMVDSYNQRAKEVAESKSYGDMKATLSTDEEITIVKYWYPNLTQVELESLRETLTQAKEDYWNASNRYKNAASEEERAAAYADMLAANKAAETARGQIGYSGNAVVAKDGGFFNTTVTEPTPVSNDGTGARILTKSYAIVATAREGGKISPEGTTYVAEETDQTYTLTPNEGYKISKIMVDGVETPVRETYTFSNISEEHTIEAFFEPNGSIAIESVQLKNADGIDLTGAGKTIKSGYGIYADVSGTYTNITEPQMVLTYHFGNGRKTVTLQESSTGQFVFPQNTASPTRQRCIYIPVATKDGTYPLTLTFTAKQADGTVLTETKTVSITVKGTMYEDDVTGDS